jgi:hypothetical protein
MQKLHSKKLDWSYAQDTSNGDSVQWRNSVLHSQTCIWRTKSDFYLNKSDFKIKLLKLVHLNGFAKHWFFATMV